MLVHQWLDLLLTKLEISGFRKYFPGLLIKTLMLMIRVFMSLLTAISGAASLLLLFIPPKIDQFSGGSGGIILTCCSPSFCQDSNSTIFSSIHNSTSNDTVALCNLHDDHTFGVVQGNKGFSENIFLCLPLTSLKKIEVICHYWRGSAVNCHGTWVISSVCPAVQTDITPGSSFGIVELHT